MAKPNGLTAKDILAKTPVRTRGGARYVVVDTAEPRLLKKLGGIAGSFGALKCKTYSTNDLDGKPKTGKPETYNTVVYSTESGKRLHLSKLKVACSCPAHVYYGGEYALWLKGAADIKYGNGEPPTDRNPRLVPWACKHISKVLDLILKKKV